MKKALILALKDFRVLRHDKFALFMAFCFPAIISLFFGAITSSDDKGPSGMKVALVDEDQSEFSQLYVSRLESYEALSLTHLSWDEAFDHVRTGKQVAAICIKEGFGDGFEAIFDSNNPKLEIAVDPARRMESGYLEGLLAKAQFEAFGERVRNRDWMRSQVDVWRNDIKQITKLTAIEIGLLLNLIDSFDKLLRDFNDSHYMSGFDGNMLNVSKVDVRRESEGPKSSFQITFAPATIWGLIACAATFAASIVNERRVGTFQRLLIAPLSHVNILGGKALACLFACIAVVCLQCAGARVIFKMPISEPMLFVPAATCVVFCFVGLMMIASTLGRTEQGVAGLTWAIFMVMAMLGGGMFFPLSAMPQWLRSISHISPIKWSILAMEGAIWRDFTLMEMIAPCGIVLSIGTVSFLLGVIILRRTEQ
jgi:ABC-2 type transport system permease protein